MSDYKVILSADFKADVRRIHSYIANTLLAPEAALNQVRRIIEATKSLSEMPSRFSLYEKDPWRKRGLRKLVVDNFIVYYLPNDKTKEVIVYRAFYGGCNIDEILSEVLNDSDDGNV